MREILKNKRVVVVALIVVLFIIVGLILLTPRNTANRGGTGGDYVPAGWVVLSGIPTEAGLTSSQRVIIGDKLTELYKERGGEYSATRNAPPGLRRASMVGS